MRIWLPLLLLLSACSDAVTDETADSAASDDAAVHADSDNASHPLPTLRAERPRLLSPDVANRNNALPANSPLQQEMSRRYLGCKDERRLHLLNCWLRTRRDDIGQLLVSRIPKFYVSEASDAGAVSTAWELALIYDALHGSPWLDADSEALARKKIKEGLRDTLNVLDEDSASLWHNRASLAATALIMAVAIGDADDEAKKLLQRAVPYFLDTMQAIALTEAWPEGYNYWIQNRAMLFAHATRAYLQGFVENDDSKYVRLAFCRHAWWPVYATRPDHRVEGLGDEGSRVDLAEETRPFIDAAASLCQQPLLAGYSDYLRARYPERSYYEDYRWGFPLFNDPALAPLPMTEPSLRFLEGVQPKAIWFGPGGMNQFYFRTRWDKDAVFLSARAGASFSHHGHYDAGHFTLFHDKPLLVNGSSYGKYFGDNRLHYAIRTIAKNSVLVLRPGEKVRPNHKFKENVSDGGQRITMPTGSAITSVADWRENLGQGQHLEGGKVLAHRADDDQFFYSQFDLTAAYNSTAYDDNGGDGKVARVQRTLVYLQPDERLLVLDDVETTAPQYTVKSLFHSIHKPQLENARVLAGRADDGILESASDKLGIQNGDGRALLQRLLPKDGVFRLVGGTHYRFYVETDGDERELDGHSYASGASEEKWFEPAYWRAELQSASARREHLHLASVAVSRGQFRADAAKLLSHEQDYLVVDTGRCLWLHALNADAVIKREVRDKDCVLVTGDARATINVTTANGVLARDRQGTGWWRRHNP